MRVTTRMMVNNAIRHMEENLQRLGDLQEKIASGKQIQNASDDPGVAAAALSLRSNLETNEAYLNTVYTTGDWMDASELALQQMVDIASRAITLTLEGLSDTQGAEERQAAGLEMDILLQQAIETGNTSHQGNFIFSGYKTTITPFALVGGTPDTVAYAGDAGLMQRSIGPGQTVTVNVDGNATFTPLFSALISARDALSNNDTETLQTALDALQSALTGVNDARNTNGARQRQLEDTAERLEHTQLALKSLLSQKEDVSLAESISELTYQETIYQAVLEVGRRAILPGLFDFLR